MSRAGFKIIGGGSTREYIDKFLNGLFRSVVKPMTGYYHWVYPREVNDNVRECTQLTKKHGFEGIVAYGLFEYCFDINYLYVSDCAWNSEYAEDMNNFIERYVYRNYKKNFTKAYIALKMLLDLMKTTNKRSL